jgi:hypothetical protein
MRDVYILQQTLVKNIHGAHDLKCKYFSQLAECYDVLPGHLKQKRTALKKGTLVKGALKTELLLRVYLPIAVYFAWSRSHS